MFLVDANIASHYHATLFILAEQAEEIHRPASSHFNA
uniref:Uncharacterized protein n=1 Tax=Anguilla anguilla TaxID=7936 RepID=A0A0E9P7N7_ANGAN